MEAGGSRKPSTPLTFSEHFPRPPTSAPSRPWKPSSRGRPARDRTGGRGEGEYPASPGPLRRLPTPRPAPAGGLCRVPSAPSRRELRAAAAGRRGRRDWTLGSQGQWAGAGLQGSARPAEPTPEGGRLSADGCLSPAADLRRACPLPPAPRV